MADDGWGEAQPEEYIEANEAPGQATIWGNAEQFNTHFQASQGENLVADPSQPQMGGVLDKHTGTVKTWIVGKGFGFITQPNGSDVFVHHSAVYAQGKASLEVGESVEFNLIISADGRLKAQNVTGPGGVHVKGSSLPQGVGASGGGATMCRNFQNSGDCRFGLSCRFSHGSGGGGGGSGSYDGRANVYGGGGGAGYSGSSSGFGDGRRKPCFNFQNNGHCKFGDRCRFGHE